MLDGEGHELVISIFVGNGRREDVRAPIEEGRSHTMAVSDTAATLVLYRGGTEVSRSPCTCARGRSSGWTSDGGCAAGGAVRGPGPES